MAKLKDPARVWKPGNLIPTATQGKTIHAVIVSRKYIQSICHQIGGPRWKYNQNSWRRDMGPEVKTADDPMGWVNCKECLRRADGWMRLAEDAPPGMCPQPRCPTDEFFR